MRNIELEYVNDVGSSEPLPYEAASSLPVHHAHPRVITTPHPAVPSWHSFPHPPFAVFSLLFLFLALHAPAGLEPHASSSQ